MKFPTQKEGEFHLKTFKLAFVVLGLSIFSGTAAMADCNLTYQAVIKSVTADSGKFFVEFRALKNSGHLVEDVKAFQDGVLKSLSLDVSKSEERALLAIALNAHEEYDLGLHEFGGIFLLTVK